MTPLWNKSEIVEPPKDRPFLAHNGKDQIWVAKWYSKEDAHPINGQTGFNSIICDCCEIKSYGEGEYWTDLPSLGLKNGKII